MHTLRIMVLIFNVSICDFMMTNDFIITQSTKTLSVLQGNLFLDRML